MTSETDARVWLRANGFSDVADAIDRIMAMWRESGRKTRRDWWEALAGSRTGKPTTAEGFTFPIIAQVRSRFGLPPVEGATKLPPGVTVPAKQRQARWASKDPPQNRRSASAKKTPAVGSPPAKKSAPSAKMKSAPSTKRKKRGD